ncbi:MAG: hypothetical protein H0X51_03450 [Parachlamydiaceae bacterium]|nr:hypothetical protein [Parachlamydiaceae bacterium]
MTKCCGFDPLPMYVPPTRFDPAGVHALERKPAQRVHICVQLLKRLVSLIVGLWMKCCSAQYVNDNIQRMTSGNLASLRPSQLGKLKEITISENRKLVASGKAICALYLGLFETQQSFFCSTAVQPKPENVKVANKLLDALSLDQIGHLSGAVKVASCQDVTSPHLFEYLLAHPERAKEKASLYSELLYGNISVSYRISALTPHQKNILIQNLSFRHQCSIFKKVVEEVHDIFNSNESTTLYRNTQSDFISQLMTRSIALAPEASDRGEVFDLFEAIETSLKEYPSAFRNVFVFEHIRSLSEISLYHLLTILPEEINENTFIYAAEIFSIWGQKLANDPQCAEAAKKEMSRHYNRDFVLHKCQNCFKDSSVDPKISPEAEKGRQFLIKILSEPMDKKG